MRVLHVIPSLDKRDGGPSVALPLMARSLAMQGIEVDVVATLGDEDAEAEGIRFGEPVQREGFTVRFFKRQTNFYKASRPLLRWLRVHVQDYALVHNHAVFSFAPLAGAWAARRAGVPYVMRPLGLLNRWGMENRRRWVKALSFRLLDRPALDRAAAIHYTSRDEKHEASRLGLRARAAVVPLGIDLEPYAPLPSPERFLDRFPAARGRRIVLFMSRLDPKKGLELLFDAVIKVNPTKSNQIQPLFAGNGPLLVVAGSGDASYVDQLKGRAVSMGLGEEVLWTGFLDGEDKLAALAAADLFVLPSHSENFGIALLEAMAAGVPCISTDQVALASELRDTGALTVVPCEAAALGEAIKATLGDPIQARVRGRLGAALVQERFSLKAVGSRLGKLYRETTA